MFDLFRSREKAVRILLGGLLLLVALSMLTYLIPSYSTGSDPSDNVLAEVGSDKIMLPDMQRLIQNAIRNRNIPAQILPNYVPELVQEAITERALEYEAQQLGFQASDADVADTIRQMMPNLFPDGKFVGKEAYAGLLAQQDLSIPEFEADLKRQIVVTRMRDIALEGTVVTPLEIEQEFRQRNQKVKIEYVKITADKYRKDVQPTEEQIQNYFKTTASQYQIPERRDLAILIADQAKLEQSVNPTDAELQQAYNQNKDQFRTPDRVKVRHILLKTTDKPASEDAQIKAKAEDLLKQINAGANFADLAKKYSEDTGSAVNGGELPDWVTRGQTVPEFERAAFSLNPGQTSGVIKTQYGYHILQVLQKEQARLRPFEEAKAELVTQLKKQRVNQLMEQASDRAQAALQKNPSDPAKVAHDFNMDLVTANGFEPGQTIPAVGASKDFDASVSTLKQGEVSQPVAVGNKIVLALATNVTPARPARLEEVKDKVRTAMIDSRLSAEVPKHAQELLDKTKSMGGDLKKAAESLGLELRTSEEFTRQGSVEGAGSASYFSEAFSRPDGSVFGPISMPGGTIVAKVIQHVEPDMSQLAEQRDSIRDEIKSRKARDRNSLFEDGVREALVKQGKIKVHQQVLMRLVNSYHG
jgi:peptidyl-prolyl cis-trans isomerase D